MDIQFRHPRDFCQLQPTKTLVEVKAFINSIFRESSIQTARYRDITSFKSALTSFEREKTKKGKELNTAQL